MKTYDEENTVGVVVYRDLIEQHNFNSNLSAVIVTKDFMEKYFKEKQKQYYKDNTTATEWFYEIYTADDTEDFYEYAKEHNAILGIEHL